MNPEQLPDESYDDPCIPKKIDNLRNKTRLYRKRVRKRHRKKECEGELDYLEEEGIKNE